MDKTSRSELTVDKKSKEIVYFLEDKTYIYGYRTVKDEFADNEEEMTVYLESFSMAVGK